MEEQSKEEIDSLENISRKEFVPRFDQRSSGDPSSEQEEIGDYENLDESGVKSVLPLLTPGQLTIWGVIEALVIILFQQALMIIFTKILGVSFIVSASYAATAILIYYFFRRKIFSAFLKSEHQHLNLKNSFILIGQGIFLCFLVMLGYDFILKLLDYSPKPQNVQQFLQTEGFTITAAYFMLVYSAPVWEEIVFRGILQDGLQKTLSPFFAVITSGLIFGVIHFDPDQMIPLILLGFIFGWMYTKSRSVFPCIIAHSFVNTVGAVNLLSKIGN
jgi:membrane protease YdiL (CAAX protease family)